MLNFLGLWGGTSENRWQWLVDNAALADALEARACCEPRAASLVEGILLVLERLVLERGVQPHVDSGDLVNWIPRRFNVMADWLAGWGRRQRLKVTWAVRGWPRCLKTWPRVRLYTDAGVKHEDGLYSWGLGGVVVARREGDVQWTPLALFCDWGERPTRMSSLEGESLALLAMCRLVTIDVMNEPLPKEAAEKLENWILDVE